MTDRDPRYTGGRTWGCILPLGLAVLALAALATIVILTGAIQ